MNESMKLLVWKSILLVGRVEIEIEIERHKKAGEVGH